MFPMRPDEAVATTTAALDSAFVATEGGSIIANLANSLKRSVAHYPESLPLGKRVFLPRESEGLSNHGDVVGNRPTSDEGGLTLLSNLASTATASWAPYDNAANFIPVDAAITMAPYTVSLDAPTIPSFHVPDLRFDSVAYFEQSHPNILDALGAHESSREACFEVTVDSKRSVDIEPTANDVLCGRGGGINKHFGNIMYRRVVEYNKNIYKQVPKRHRMLVSRSIVLAICNAGGRFLQSSGGEGSPVKWTEIPIRRAVQKTSQALRERSEDDMAAKAKEEDNVADQCSNSRPLKSAA